MKYLVKVDAGDGKVETYTTEATDAAAAMLQAYDKYGVCGVMVSPVEEEAAPVAMTDADVQRIANEGVKSGELSWLGFDKDNNDKYTIPVLSRCHFQLAHLVARALKSTAPACPVDTAIANLDALLAERRAAEQAPTLPTKDELMDEIRDVITGSEDLMSYSPEGGVGRRLGVAKENMNRMIDQLFAALPARQAPAHGGSK